MAVNYWFSGIQLQQLYRRRRHYQFSSPKLKLHNNITQQVTTDPGIIWIDYTTGHRTTQSR